MFYKGGKTACMATGGNDSLTCYQYIACSLSNGHRGARLLRHESHLYWLTSDQSALTVHVHSGKSWARLARIIFDGSQSCREREDPLVNELEITLCNRRLCRTLTQEFEQAFALISNVSSEQRDTVNSASPRDVNLDDSDEAKLLGGRKNRSPESQASALVPTEARGNQFDAIGKGVVDAMPVEPIVRNYVDKEGGGQIVQILDPNSADRRLDNEHFVDLMRKLKELNSNGQWIVTFEPSLLVFNTRHQRVELCDFDWREPRDGQQSDDGKVWMNPGDPSNSTFGPPGLDEPTDGRNAHIRQTYAVLKTRIALAAMQDVRERYVDVEPELVVLIQSRLFEHFCSAEPESRQLVNQKYVLPWITTNVRYRERQAVEMLMLTPREFYESAAPVFDAADVIAGPRALMQKMAAEGEEDYNVAWRQMTYDGETASTASAAVPASEPVSTSALLSGVFYAAGLGVLYF